MLENEIINLINSCVLNASKEEVKEIYNQLFSKKEEKGISNNYVKNKAIIHSKQKIPIDSILSGIDLPFWFGKKENKRILFLGIDPLRNKGIFKDEKANIFEDVIIGTPYAFHSLDARNIFCKRYWVLIEKLSKNNFVYCTDIFKTYFKSNNVRSYKNNDFINNQTHKEIIEREIELVKPDVIITMGGLAYKFLTGCRAPKLSNNIDVNIEDFKGIKILPFPHLSGGTRHKPMESFLRNNGFSDVNGSKRENCAIAYSRLILDRIS